MIDASMLTTYGSDTIVNAAKPTLMGSNQGIDGAIHTAIDKILSSKGESVANSESSSSIIKRFRDKIQEELGSNTRSDRIRCPRGNAVITKGYGLCDHIIHAVGIPYDGNINENKDCSSSRVNTIESCYLEIMKIVKRSDTIKNIGIPIIGSGEYGFPFELAARIAISAIGNELVEWCKYDSDSFEMSELNTVYFFIYSNDTNKENKYCDAVKVIINELKPYFNDNRKVVFQSALEAHRRYWNEVDRHDESRGYFSIVKKARKSLLAVKTFFLIPMAFGEWWDKKDWLKRRCFVEKYAFYKMLLPLILYYVYKLVNVIIGEMNWFTVGFGIWIMYMSI